MEVLMALASSVQYLRDVSHARRLLNQFGTYLIDSIRQPFESSIYIAGELSVCIIMNVNLI